MKATSIFGGVQIINIILNIVRTKFVAVLLGPVGVGINGLYSSTITLVSSFTGMGLKMSAIKNIAEKDKPNEVAEVFYILSFWVWITGFLGFILFIIFAEHLSYFVFDNANYAIGFRILSIILLVNQLKDGKQVLIQGTRHIKYLAKVNVFSSIAGVIIAIPLYYQYNLDGIVPSMLLISIVNLLVTFFFQQKIKLPKARVSLRKVWEIGKEILLQGFLLSISGQILFFTIYSTRIFISSSGTLDDVGLYNAGYSMTTIYVGMIFNAMGTDYFPRLSKVNQNRELLINNINQQLELGIIILTPLVCFLIFFIKWIILIIYSEAFLEVTGMVTFMVMGMTFRLLAWVFGYLFIAKGQAKLFLFNELGMAIYFLAFNFIAFKYFGLTALGIAFLLGYFIYSIQVMIICKLRYDIHLEREAFWLFCKCLCLIIGIYISIYSSGESINFIGLFIIVISFIFSYSELNKRMDLENIIRNKLFKS